MKRKLWLLPPAACGIGLLLFAFWPTPRPISMPGTTFGKNSLSSIASLRASSDQVSTQLRDARSQIQNLRQYLQQHPPRGEEWSARQGQLQQLEGQMQRLEQLAFDTQRRVTQIDERLQEEVRELRRQVQAASSKSSDDSTMLKLGAGILGLIGTVSSGLLAWRSDARDQQKLELERAKHEREKKGKKTAA